MDAQGIFWSTASVIVLAVLFAFWLRKRVRLKHAHSWPIADGKVIATSVTLKSEGGGTGSSAYYAEVQYSYGVAGSSFSGSHRRRFLLKGRAEKWAENYTAQKNLTVRYNPRKTHDSVLLADDLDAHSPA